MRYINSLGQPSILLHALRTNEEGRLGDIGESQTRSLRPSTKIVGAFDQYMYAVSANGADEESREKAENETSISECQWHSQYTGTETSFEQMYQRV